RSPSGVTLRASHQRQGEGDGDGSVTLVRLVAERAPRGSVVAEGVRQHLDQSPQHRLAQMWNVVTVLEITLRLDLARRRAVGCPDQQCGIGHRAVEILPAN